LDRNFFKQSTIFYQGLKKKGGRRPINEILPCEKPAQEKPVFYGTVYYQVMNFK